VGQSLQHSGNVPIACNPTMMHISPQFHTIFNNQFAMGAGPFNVNSIINSLTLQNGNIMNLLEKQPIYTCLTQHGQIHHYAHSNYKIKTKHKNSGHPVQSSPVKAHPALDNPISNQHVLTHSTSIDNNEESPPNVNLSPFHTTELAIPIAKSQDPSITNKHKSVQLQASPCSASFQDYKRPNGINASERWQRWPARQNHQTQTVRIMLLMQPSSTRLQTLPLPIHQVTMSRMLFLVTTKMPYSLKAKCLKILTMTFSLKLNRPR